MTGHSYSSAWLRHLEARGFIRQVTDPAGLDAYAHGHPVAYIGFDATAPSLHVGSLVQIMMLRSLQQHGGTPIILLGGGTTRVGDPSERNTSRPMLSEDDITGNMARIGAVFSRFLDQGDKPGAAILANNADWLNELRYIDFLRNVGTCFTINTMIRQETVARRLRAEIPCTFLEFNYSLLQAYDFLELNRRHDCRVQLGGSDQWGNIVAGIDLCRRIGKISAFGLTAPLVTTASGAKMGKTADGAVWLDAERCSPFDYWQFWRNCDDGDVGRFLRLFTDLPLTEIAGFEALDGADINAAKIALADAATTMLHGSDSARQAREAARAVFDLAGISSDLPTLDLDQEALAGGYLLIDACVASGLAASKSEARRHVRAGALRLNDSPVHDEKALLHDDDFAAAGHLRLSVGRKRHVRLRRT